MPHYRIYGLDADGRIASVVEAEHEDDGQAMQHALSLKHRHGTDVWQGARCVGHVAPMQKNG